MFHGKKLDALEDLLESANGRPVLVAYWFKHDLTRIMERLKKLKVDCRKLDSDEHPGMECGEDSGGTDPSGKCRTWLNLQSGGNILVWFGLTWSLELYQQTVARLWRQGQESGTVSVIHIVTDGTVDERSMKALEMKDGHRRR